MIVGFVVNKFRGDPSLFADGMTLIAARTGWAPLGLVPFFPEAARLPAEDSLALSQHLPRRPGAKLRVAVPVLPHIANFDDLDPLAAEPAVDLVRVPYGEALPGDAHLVILPGSKATIADLAALRQAGLDIDIAAHLRRGGTVLGMCGGYQMLGTQIADPQGIEGPAGAVPGLGLLHVGTVLSGDKRLLPARGRTTDSAPFAGYEMHLGMTKGPDRSRPFAQLEDGSPEGAMSADGRVLGTYVHGLFAHDGQRAAWLARFAAGAPALDYEASIDRTLDALADHLTRHVDLDQLLRLMR